MELKSLKKIKSLQSIIQEQLKLYIIDSGLKSGDILPSEKELAEGLGISRTSIREALIALKTLGMIETKRGIGRFIKSFNYEAILQNLSYRLELDTNNFWEALEVRFCLESWFIVKEINKYTPSDIKNFNQILDKLEELVQKEAEEERLIEIHTKFHCALYENSKNSLMIDLIKIFSTIQRNLTILHRYKTRNREIFIDYHRALVKAIELKDPILAQKRLIEHFTEAKEWVEQNIGKGKAESIGSGMWYRGENIFSVESSNKKK